MEQNTPHSRKIKMILIIIIIFISAWSKNYAQNTGGLKIIVRDSASKELIPFASIRVIGTRIGTGTSTGGYYILNKIPVGRQKLEINSIGYNPVINEVVIKKDTFLLLNVTLSTSPVMLQPVTKITDRLREFDETNISIRQISQAELKIIPLTIEKDFIRAIKVLPGISTSSDVTSQFFVRGGGGDQNLILFDNMLIYNPFHTLGLFSIFNSDAVKSAEILTGGFNPEFGGRLSSVINITSKDGNKNRSAMKVNLGMLTGNGFLEGPIPFGSYFIAYRKSFFNNILQKFLDKDVPLTFYDFSGKITFDISDAGKLSFNLLKTGDEITNYSLTEQKYLSNSYAFGGSIQSFVSNLIVTTSFSLSKHTTEMTSIVKKIQTNSKNVIGNYSLTTKANLLFTKNDLLTFGAILNNQYFRYSFVNDYGYKITNDDPLREVNLFANYKFTQIEGLGLDLGLRTNFSYLSKSSYTNIEPRVNVKFDLTSNFSLKGSYSRMSQTVISTVNEDDVVSLFEIFLPIRNQFKPERADQYAVGFETNIMQFINLNIQAYTKKVTNYLGYNLERKNKNDPDFVSGSGNSKGIETYIRYEGNIIYGWITYNLNYSERTLNGFTFPPRYDKRHNLNVIVGAKLPYDIGLNFHWELSSGMPFSPIAGYYDQTIYPNIPFDTSYSTMVSKSLYGVKNSGRLPSYHKLDINISKGMVIKNNFKLNFNIDISNVYDQKNIFYFNKEDNQRINMLPFLITFSAGVEL